jgi:hypothetical protein
MKVMIINLSVRRTPSEKLITVEMVWSLYLKIRPICTVKVNFIILSCIYLNKLTILMIQIKRTQVILTNY